MDPDKILQMVMQYLDESGYPEALEKLQAESSYTFDPSSLNGSELLTTLNEHYELTLGSGLLSDASALSGAKEIDELLGCDQDHSDYKLPTKQVGTLEGVHSGNILCCAINPSNPDLLVTAGSDRTVSVSSISSRTRLHSFSSIHSSAVLSASFHPTIPNVFVSSGMDGSAVIANCETGEVIQSFKEHSKYCIRSSFSPCGKFMATGSYDHSVRLYASSSADTPLYSFVQAFSFATNVESVEFSGDSSTLIIASRECNYLHHVDLNKPEFPMSDINMNSNGDDHVSFSAMDTAVSPNGNAVLVATDRSRLILFRRETSQQLRNFYGLTNDGFANPKITFSPNGQHIFATSQDNAIYVYNVCDQKIGARLKAHTNTIRDVVHHPTQPYLISVGFDKIIRIWGPQEE